jgi:uncharacterized membrane protein YgcG
MFANQGDESKLSTLFTHYCKLSQWECARLTARQLHVRSPQRAKELLREVASRSSSSPLLVHLAAHELHLLGETFPANLVASSAFDMTLHSLKTLCSREQARVLDRFKVLVAGPDPFKKMASADLAKLQEVVALFPLLGNNLIARWLPGHMQIYLDVIQGLLAKSQLHEALSFFAFLQPDNFTGKETRQLDGILEKLVAFDQRFVVYQALLSAPGADQNSMSTVLVERFAALEEAAVKQDYREAVPRVFLNAKDEDGTFWRALHTLSVVAGKHFFEIVTEKAQLAAHEGRFADCALLLKQFDKLAPLIMAMFASKCPGQFKPQHELLTALKLSSWRLEAAAWCGAQVCLSMTSDAALLQLEKMGLLELVGESLNRIEDRDGLLALLQHSPDDRESCLRFFALKDVYDHKPFMCHAWLSQMREWRAAALECLNAGLAVLKDVDQFGSLLESVKETFRSKGEKEDELVVEAAFRLKLAKRLKSASCLTDSGSQLLLDVGMAEEWELCAETRRQFGLTEASPVVSFVAREEELSRHARVSDDEDFLALADLAFSLSVPEESLRALERACAAAPVASDVADLLNRSLIVARGRRMTFREVLTLSREFPTSVPLLEAWVERENRIRAMAVKVREGELESELELDASAPLSVFLRYVVVLKRAGMTLERLPEEVLSELVQRGDEELAKSVAKMLGVNLIDALISRRDVAISLPELKLIAASDPLLAARVALQRQGESANLELLDFAVVSLSKCPPSKDGYSSLLRTVASCRLYAAVDNGTIPWSLWSSDPVELHRRLCERLFEMGRYEDALSIADEHLPEGPSDAVLACVARQGGPDCWRFIVRCSDRQLGAELALSLLEELELAEAIDVLEMCVRCGRPQLETAVVAKLKLLRAYLPILRHRNVFGPWRTWQELHRACLDNTGQVVKQLLEWKQFDLAKMISECLGTGANLDIDADALLHLLEHGGDEESVTLFLQTLKEPMAAVQAVLQACQTPEARVILWGFLKDADRLMGARALSLLPSLLNDDSGGGGGGSVAGGGGGGAGGGGGGGGSGIGPRSASRARRGLFGSSDALIDSSTSLSSIPGSMILKKTLRSMLAHLEAHPAALVESLMMNEKISELGQIFKFIPSLINDEKLILYARKALAFDWAVRESVRDFSTLASAVSPMPSPVSAVLPEAEFVALTGNEVEDMAARRSHFYRKAPSINLSTALLDLCSCPRHAARACLDICSHLSSLLSSTPSSGLLLLLNLVKQLLFYAKLQFTKETTEGQKTATTQKLTFLIDDAGGGEAGIAVCQT